MTYSEITQLREYCNSITAYSRWETREVMVGSIGFGGKNPIRIQSMTTTDTMDTLGTVEQSIRMIEAGCELIRITAPSKNEAENLKNIKDELVKRGYNTPLVADIHFTPNAAEIAAKIVEKVRINPGNYADKKKFEVIEYTGDAYQEELDRIRERFTPLVLICKEHGTAMRIGTNHGSLSDRILSRYGDTPEGMVESAMEFLRICRDLDYHEILLSMKASNTLVMVQAYRLLVATMKAEGMNYPLHLGVTEAGEAEDGRIKSAVGIGTLLEDGLGDTIRVSLTEDPEFEAPVAEKLAERVRNRVANPQIAPLEGQNPVNPFAHHRRETREIMNIGGKKVPVVIADFSAKEQLTAANLFGVGYNYSVPLDKWNIADQACDYVMIGKLIPDFEIPGTLGFIADLENWKTNFSAAERVYPMIDLHQLDQVDVIGSPLVFLRLSDTELIAHAAKLKAFDRLVILLHTENTHAMAAMRRSVFELMAFEVNLPVVAHTKPSTGDGEQFMLDAAAELGALFVDGLIDGIQLSSDEIPIKIVNQTAFGILQAARTRISKTEYISCPSCGRTLFDLQETTAKIRSRTDHLKGIKIGIMGCIVNGPGEMADADYGYVGVGVGKITLYKEKEVVKKNIPAEQAVDELIELIKANGDWVEKTDV
ncbi:MAG: (E)-4-hydroxy-3-methylbut-2-enyl-diphosphate synthase [Bacteroidota bacterium]